MRIVFSCLWIGLAGKILLMSFASLSQVTGSKPKNEIVMSPGMEITVRAPTGTMTITARDGLVRAYTWEGATRSVEMIARETRWYGSLGLYYDGPGDHWKAHNGITRGVLDEGQQHFKTTAEAIQWIHTRDDLPLVYRDDGLAVGWNKELPRNQLNVEVWQIYINGSKPHKLPGSENGNIVVTFGQAGISPLARAVQSGNLKAVQALLNKGADPNIKNSVEAPVLVVAAGRGDTAMVQALLAKGANTEARDAESATALLKAVEKSQIGVVRVLLAKEAKTEAAYEMGQQKGATALILAALVGNEAIARTLLESGANAKASDHMGMTALAYWVVNEKGNVSFAEMLINKGAEVDSRDWLGMTPLMVAAREGQVDIVKLLIARKANVNARDDKTRRMYAAAEFNGDLQVVKELKSSGRLNALHEDGMSVLDWAENGDHKNIVDLLKAAGANQTSGN